MATCVTYWLCKVVQLNIVIRLTSTVTARQMTAKNQGYITGVLALCEQYAVREHFGVSQPTEQRL